MRALLLLSLITLPAAPIMAHGGGLNAQGCHNNRKTGDYHCHGGGGRKAAPAKVNRSLSVLSVSTGNATFANCAEARAAGAAPVRRGDPGYGPRLDRDGDGVGCE